MAVLGSRGAGGGGAEVQGSRGAQGQGRGHWKLATEDRTPPNGDGWTRKRYRSAFPPDRRRRQRAIRRLVRLLRRLQLERTMTLRDMAGRLGVSKSTLCMVYGGRRSPGAKFLRGVLESFPELHDEVCRFLLLDMGDGHGEETNGA